MNRVFNLFAFSKKFSQKLQISFFKIIYICFYWQINGEHEFALNLNFKNKDFIFHVSNRFELGTLNDIFVKEEYNFQYKKEVNNILDLGANIGDTAIYFSILFPFAKIFAVEPNPVILKKLEKNTKDFPNIKICPCAVSDKTGKISLFIGGSHLGSSINVREQNTETVEVDSFSIEDFCNKENIGHVDILKFDIEGAEEYLLQSSFLKSGGVKELVGEIHTDLVKIDVREQLLSLNLSGVMEKIISKNRYIIFGNFNN